MTARAVLDEPRHYFGWAVNYRVPDPVEAEAIRVAARDLLAGATLQDIANRWNADEDVNTIFGGKWFQNVIEGVLRRRTNAPLLLDVALQQRLVAHLDDPKTRVPPSEVRKQRALAWRKGRAANLLTLIARCSTCGDLLITDGNPSGFAWYVCRTRRATGHPLSHDGRAHGSCAIKTLDAAVIETMERLFPYFAGLDLHEQRALVEQQVTVTAYPRATYPRFTIERRTA